MVIEESDLTWTSENLGDALQDDDVLQEGESWEYFIEKF
jgi:hypothetical protein